MASHAQRFISFQSLSTLGCAHHPISFNSSALIICIFYSSPFSWLPIYLFFLSCMRWCTVKAQNALSRCCHAKVSNDVESQWCFPKGLRWLTNKLHTKTGMTKLKTLWNNTERAKYFIKLPPLYWFACETSSNYFVRTLQYDGWLLLLPSIYLERVYFNQFFFLAANRRALTYGNAMAEHHYNQTDSACLSFRVTMKKN